MIRNRLGLVLAAVIPLALSGCGKPPEQEMQQAENVIREAQQADAHKFARPELANAERLLKDAREASQAGKYDIARQRALQANTAAAQAVETAQRNKKIFEENAARRAEEEAIRRKAEEEEARRRAEEEARIREEALKAEMAALEAQEPEEELPPPPPAPVAAAPKPVEEYSARRAPEPSARREAAYSESYRGSTRSYTTQRYDTLGKIARDQLGDSRLWPAIYDLNKDRIPDPDRVPKDVTIEIPTDLSADQKADARDRAAGRGSDFSLFDGQ